MVITGRMTRQCDKHGQNQPFRGQHSTAQGPVAFGLKLVRRFFHCMTAHTSCSTTYSAHASLCPAAWLTSQVKRRPLIPCSRQALCHPVACLLAG